MHLATYVMDANELADITVLKEKAKTVEAMTHQLLKIYREV